MKHNLQKTFAEQNNELQNIQKKRQMLELDKCDLIKENQHLVTEAHNIKQYSGRNNVRIL